MEKSHKFLLTALLLAGGYGTALLLGSLSAWIVPQPAGRANAKPAGGTLVPMTHHDAASAVPALPLTGAPATNLASTRKPLEVGPAALKPIEIAPLDVPTWLPAASEPAAFDAASVEVESPRPIAKIRDVSPWGAVASTASASPWDRWPQWDPSSTLAQQSRSAGYEAGDKAAAPAVQAGYRSANRDDYLEDEADAKGFRSHIVVDGDSLAKLADRYLDDPQMAEAIYELNRSVLNDPELLPIGVELQIPDRRQSNTPLAEATLQTVAVTTPREPHGFESVDRWLEGGGDVPRAQLLQPMPIGRGE